MPSRVGETDEQTAVMVMDGLQQKEHLAIAVGFSVEMAGKLGSFFSMHVLFPFSFLPFTSFSYIWRAVVIVLFCRVSSDGLDRL